MFYKHLAQSLADRRNQDYAMTASRMRSFLLCLRGSRSVLAKNNAAEEIEIRRAVVEALPHRHHKFNLRDLLFFIYISNFDNDGLP